MTARSLPQHSIGGDDDPVASQVAAPPEVEALCPVVEGTVHTADLEVERTRDCKVMGTGGALPAGPFVSTSAASWKGAVGKRIKARFVEPSPYERNR